MTMAIQRIKRDSREEWLELRKKYIGGADAASVCGLNDYQSPYALWCEKTGVTPPFEGNLRTEVGTYLEDFIAKRFESETGKKVMRSNFSFVNSLFPWAVADVDREIVGENAGLECKSTSALNLKHYKNGDYPARFYVQCVHYIAVKGYDRMYLKVLIGNSEERLFIIERDEDEIAALMELEKQFYEYMVRKQEPPAIAADVESLDLTYPISNGGSIELFGQKPIMKQWLDLKAEIAGLQEKMDGIAAALKQDMGEAEIGTDGEYIATWQNRKRTTFDKKAFQKDNPSIDLSRWEKTTNYRVFGIKEAG